MDREQIARGARGLPNAATGRMRYAPGWPDDERDAASDRAGGGADSRRRGHEEAAIARRACRCDPRGNVLDGTLAGLLADRNEIGARLLDERVEEAHA